MVREGQGTGAGQSTRTRGKAQGAVGGACGRRKGQGAGAGARQRTGAGQGARMPEGTGHGGGRQTHARYECDVGAVHAHGAHVVVPP